VTRDPQVLGDPLTEIHETSDGVDVTIWVTSTPSEAGVFIYLLRIIIIFNAEMISDGLQDVTVWAGFGRDVRSFGCWL
jgi:hypothetical protein